VSRHCRVGDVKDLDGVAGGDVRADAGQLDLGARVRDRRVRQHRRVRRAADVEQREPSRRDLQNSDVCTFGGDVENHRCRLVAAELEGIGRVREIDRNQRASDDVPDGHWRCDPGDVIDHDRRHGGTEEAELAGNSGRRGFAEVDDHQMRRGATAHRGDDEAGPRRERQYIRAAVRCRGVAEIELADEVRGRRCRDVDHDQPRSRADHREIPDGDDAIGPATDQPTAVADAVEGRCNCGAERHEDQESGRNSICHFRTSRESGLSFSHDGPIIATQTGGIGAPG